jgi:hypothetical protein
LKSSTFWPSLRKKSNKAEVSIFFTNKFLLTKPFSKVSLYLKKLRGKNDIEDALKRLDSLTQEEARKAAAQLLKAVNTIDNRVGGIADNALVVDNRVAGVDDRMAGVDGRRSWSPNRIHTGHAGSTVLTGNPLRQELRGWLSPPDPSTNHNIACNAHHKGTAAWFFEGRVYNEWKSTGSDSLLWIRGKRASLSHPAVSRHLITSLYL